MNIEIMLNYDPDSGKPDPYARIQEIVRQSYDFQHNGMDYDIVKLGSMIQYIFYFYPDYCDQPKRTVETLRKIEDLLISYI